MVPKLTLEMWPSMDELTEGERDSEYLGCATGFWRSIYDFLAAALARLSAFFIRVASGDNPEDIFVGDEA